VLLFGDSYHVSMNSKTGIVFSAAAITAIVLLFGSGSLLPGHQALAYHYSYLMRVMRVAVPITMPMIPVTMIPVTRMMSEEIRER